MTPTHQGRPVEHGVGRVWGSRAGATVTCECGADLGASHEPIRERIAEHVAAYEREAAA